MRQISGEWKQPSLETCEINQPPPRFRRPTITLHMQKLSTYHLQQARDLQLVAGVLNLGEAAQLADDSTYQSRTCSSEARSTRSGGSGLRNTPAAAAATSLHLVLP